MQGKKIIVIIIIIIIIINNQLNNLKTWLSMGSMYGRQGRFGVGKVKKKNKIK